MAAHVDMYKCRRSRVGNVAGVGVSHDQNETLFHSSTCVCATLGCLVFALWHSEHVQQHNTANCPPWWPAEYLPQHRRGSNNHWLKCKCEVLTEVSGTTSSAESRELLSVHKFFSFFSQRKLWKCRRERVAVAEARMAAAERMTGFIHPCLKCSGH